MFGDFKANITSIKLTFCTGKNPVINDRKYFADCWQNIFRKLNKLPVVTTGIEWKFTRLKPAKCANFLPVIFLKIYIQILWH